MMRIARTLFISAGVALALLAPRPARAQFRAPGASNPAIGETYRAELMVGLWNPEPDMIISSEQLGIAGTSIDLVADLGVAQARFREFRLVLRPARKHKLRLQYIPIRYSGEAVLTRDLVFNGIRYRVGVPVNTGMTWKAWRLGYEYDFVSRDRGFAGFIVEAKYTDVEVRLDSPLAAEFARARAPIPAVGGIGRVYVLPSTAVTFELTGFKLPQNIDEGTRGTYLDVDVYGTVNFSDNFGLQVGYRSVGVSYQVEQDAGDLKLKGTYVGAVARF